MATERFSEVSEVLKKLESDAEDPVGHDADGDPETKQAKAELFTENRYLFSSWLALSLRVHRATVGKNPDKDKETPEAAGSESEGEESKEASQSEDKDTALVDTWTRWIKLR